MEKPNIRFQDGQWLDADRLNKAMEAVDASVGATNAAEASAAGANTSAAQSAQSANTARQDADNAARDLAAVKAYVDGNQTVGEQGANIALLQQASAFYQQLIGPYQKRIVIPLTADYATGKVLVVNPATGMVELTEKAGWGVTRLTAENLKAQHVDAGDTAFVYMLDSEGRNLNEPGIKVFVIETEVKGEDGQVIRRTLTSKFNAPNADVTISGHLQTGYDLQPDQNLLICHPLSTSSVEFLRTAEGAKEATTKLNLTAMMEKLATKEGVFLQMIAGLAEGIWDTNQESGNAREWLVGRPVIGCPDLVIPRMANIDARSGQNKDIVVDKVAGGVCGGNQMFAETSMVSTVSDNRECLDLQYQITKQSGGYQAKSIARLPYDTTNYQVLELITLEDDAGAVLLKHNGKSMDIRLGTARVAAKGHKLLMFANITGCDITRVGGVKVDVEYLLDLTTLFPLDQPFVTSLGSGDATRVLTRLGIIALDD